MVKERLQCIHKSPVDYKVIFSDERNSREGGFYKLSSREIIIRNENFAGAEGVVKEMLLMYTAIHELAHHVMAAEKGDSTLAHSQEFWDVFHDFLDKAEEKGITWKPKNS